MGEETFEPLFRADDGTTLTEFYESYYLVNCMAPDASEGYRQLMQIPLQRWRLVTGDPPLAKIDNNLLVKFRDFLLRSRGQAPGSQMTAITIRNYLTIIHRLLVKAGPPGIRNYDAADLIPRVPWVRPPREELPPPKIVAAEQLNQVYRAAEMMVMPQFPGIEPADWWRALLVVAYNTGLRRRTLFEMLISDIDWERRQAVLPPKRLKSRRAQIVHLNKPALEHLKRIRGERERVFPWPYCREHFDKIFHRLQYDAGLPRTAHFGLHDLRRTFGTALWGQAPEAAQLALGHTSATITRQRYVCPDAIVTRALDRLPQPETFKRKARTGVR